MSNSKRFLVLDGFDENMSSVGNLTVISHRLYAERQGYSFETVRSYKAGSHPSWQKLEIIRDRLNDYDCILWLDADVVVTNMSIQISDILGNMEGIVCSRDWCLEGSDFSAGVLIITRCMGSRQVIDAAMRKTEWKNKLLWDQSALQEVYHKDEGLRGVFHILPRRTLNSVPSDAQSEAVEPWQSGDFICHLTGISNALRIFLFDKYNSCRIREDDGGHKSLFIIPVKKNIDPRLLEICRRKADEIKKTYGDSIDVVINDSGPGDADIQNIDDRQSHMALVRQSILSASLKDDHTEVFWMDADLIEFDVGIIREFRKWKNVIVAPLVLVFDNGIKRFYDLCGFVDNNGRIAREARPYFDQSGAVLLLNSVGAFYMVPASVYRAGATYHPVAGYVEHYSICEFARRKLGMSVICDTRFEVLHAWLPDYGEKIH